MKKPLSSSSGTTLSETSSETSSESDEETFVAALVAAQPRMFRPPYGSFPQKNTDRQYALLKHADIAFAWSVDAEDWKPSEISSVEKLLTRLDTFGPAMPGFGAKGHIILFHELPDSIPANPANLRPIVQHLRGYCPNCAFRNLDYCFEKSMHPGVVAARKRVEARKKNPGAR